MPCGPANECRASRRRVSETTAVNHTQRCVTQGCVGIDRRLVFEFAKEIGVETLTLMDKIREWKLPVKSHMATLDDAMMEEIKIRLASASQATDSKTGKKKTATRKKYNFECKTRLMSLIVFI